MSEESTDVVPQEAPRRRSLSCCLYVTLVLAGLLPCLLWAGSSLNRLSNLVKRASGGNDLHVPLTASLNFAEDHAGLFPPLDPEPGRMMFERKVMSANHEVTGKTVTMEHDTAAPFRWADYRNNPALDKNLDLIDDHSWWYLGYVIRNNAEAREFLRAYLAQVLRGGDFSEDLVVPGPGRKIPRLRTPDGPANDSGAEPERSSIPVFVERPGHYQGFSGGHVAYLDGHVEYHDYPGPFPMSQEVISILQAVDQVGQALNDSGEKLH